MEQEVVTVGLELAKNVFQAHAIAADGLVLILRNLDTSKNRWRMAGGGESLPLRDSGGRKW